MAAERDREHKPKKIAGLFSGCFLLYSAYQINFLLHRAGHGFDHLYNCLRMNSGDLFGKLPLFFLSAWKMHDDMKLLCLPLYDITAVYAP